MLYSYLMSHLYALVSKIEWRCNEIDLKIAYILSVWISLTSFVPVNDQSYKVIVYM
jgi:hypothetical protein